MFKYMKTNNSLQQQFPINCLLLLVRLISKTALRQYMLSVRMKIYKGHFNQYKPVAKVVASVGFGVSL